MQIRRDIKKMTVTFKMQKNINNDIKRGLPNIESYLIETLTLLDKIEEAPMKQLS